MLTPSRVIFVSICSGFILGRIPVYLSPWLLGEFIDKLGFTGSEAGAIVSFELIGVAIAALVLSPFIRIVSIPIVAITGAAIACAAHFASMIASDFALFAILRFAAGLGVGLVITTCVAVVAQQAAPEKTYANVHTVMALVSTLTFYTVGYIVGFASYKGIFLMMALLCLMAIPIFKFLPRKKIPIENIDQSKKRSFMVSGVISTLAVFLFALGDVGAFVFIERVAQRSQLSPQMTGFIIGTGALLSVSGALLAGLIGLRFGRQLPFIFGLGIMALSIIGLYQSQSAMMFAFMNFWISTSWFFCLPYILGLAAALDKSGSLAATATSALYWGIAISPGILGIVFDQFGLNTVGYLCSALVLIALILFILVSRQIPMRD